jgi:Raf kinase inhibitor-like YbhB/YbcL family protein
VVVPQAMLQGTPTPGFTLTAANFKEGDTLPAENTCAPYNANPNAAPSPMLSWTGAPASARSFVLVEQDMDVPPPGGPVVHWLIFNIPSSASSLPAAIPQGSAGPGGSIQGVNSVRSIGYIGSCPPPGAAPHHYVFQLFALDNTLTVSSPAVLPDVNTAMQGHIVAQTALATTFGRT